VIGPTAQPSANELLQLAVFQLAPTTEWETVKDVSSNKNPAELLQNRSIGDEYSESASEPWPRSSAQSHHHHHHLHHHHCAYRLGLGLRFDNCGPSRILQRHRPETRLRELSYITILPETFERWVLCPQSILRASRRVRVDWFH
jgi:hypothetical protein